MNGKVLAKLAYVLLCSGFLAGCAGTSTKRVPVDPAAAEREEKRQRELFVKQQNEGQKRVQALAQPLLVDAAELCDEDIKAYLGFVAVNVHQWPNDYQEAARSVLNIDDEMRIGLVVPGSPAAEAGLQEGDILTMVNDEHVAIGKKGTKQTAKLLLDEAAVGEQAILTVERDGEKLEIPITPIAACNYYVALIADDQVNAFADGNNIYITTGMLRFTDSDLELQTVLAHELAHNAMDHIDKKKTNYLFGSIFDVVAAAYGVNTQGAFGNAAAKAYSQDFEAEADYVGMYVMALADLDITNVADFWRRMGANTPGAIQTQYSGTHPGTAERYLALGQINAEIDAKSASGQPLAPDYKKTKEAGK